MPATKPVPLKQLAKSYDPLFVTVRTFLDDARLWRWELAVWIGDVDVLGTEPSMRSQSPKSYKSRGVAYKSGLAAAGRVK